MHNNINNEIYNELEKSIILAKTKDLVLIGKYMGHESVETTKKYIFPEMLEIHRKTPTLELIGGGIEHDSTNN